MVLAYDLVGEWPLGKLGVISEFLVLFGLAFVDSVDRAVVRYFVSFQVGLVSKWLWAIVALLQLKIEVRFGLSFGRRFARNRRVQTLSLLVVLDLLNLLNQLLFKNLDSLQVIDLVFFTKL